MLNADSSLAGTSWAAHARKVDDASSGQFIPAQGVVEQEMHVTDDMGLARIA
jgi:hypothetical protein